MVEIKKPQNPATPPVKKITPAAGKPPTGAVKPPTPSPPKAPPLTSHTSVAKTPTAGAPPSKTQTKSPTAPGVPTVEVTPEKKKKKFSLPFFGGVSSKQLAQFTTQFAVLIDAGLPLVRTLKILEDQQPPGYFKDIIANIREQVEAGTPLADAFASHPKVFDDLYVYTVKAGEKSGTLDAIMRRLGEFMEKSLRLKRKIISASTYPAVVISAAILIVAGLMVKVVPKFEDILRDQKGAQMPAMTQFLLNTSKTLAANWYFLIAVPIVFVVIYKILNKKPATKYILDKIKMKIPIIGGIIQKTAIVRFTRTLGTLLASAVPILEALDIIKNALGNEVYARSVEEIKNSLKEGESIAPIVKSTGLYGDFVYNMIQVGEETGELDKMLIKIADTYDDEIDAAVSALTGIIEPVLIIFIAVVIGFIVVALFMPLMSIMQSMGGGM
jgi:type IV pilus assembly protein PilC